MDIPREKLKFNRAINYHPKQFGSRVYHVEIGHLIPGNMAEDEKYVSKFSMDIIFVKLAKKRIPGFFYTCITQELFCRKKVGLDFRVLPAKKPIIPLGIAPLRLTIVFL